MGGHHRESVLPCRYSEPVDLMRLRSRQLSIYYPCMFRKTIPSILLCLWLVQGCSQPHQPTLNLYRAVQIGDLDQIERNLYWHAELNEVGPDGLTPLHLAAQKGSLVICKTLLRHGADLEARDPQGHTPLVKALIARNTLLANYLAKQGAKLDANAILHETARLGAADRDVIDFLIKQGASVDQQDEEGDTPLHNAIQHDRRVVAKYLIIRGADLSLANKAGQTPLSLAIALKRTDIERMLRQLGATESRP